MIRDISRQQMLNLDLSSGRSWVEEVPSVDLERFLGGRGINAKILYERVKPGIDPLGPENLLIFGTGMLTGTSAPSAARTCVTCKGPATGGYLKSSVGGHFGADLKYAGYDYLVVSGAAEKPIYLWINDRDVEIRDASHLWGRGTRETDRLLKEELREDDIQTAIIGPGGENKLLFSAIIVSRYNAAARGGIGAVMGSKNLKAIAVRGTGGLKLAEGKEFFDLSVRVRQDLTKDSSTERHYRWGTAGAIPAMNELGMLPTCNFQRNRFEGAETLSGQYLEAEGYLGGRESCFGCSIACHRFVRTKEHRYGEVQDSGPELEAMCDLGTACGHADIEAVIKANQLCMDYGLDVASTGYSISWAMETYEKGLIKDPQTDGLDLRFGNPQTVLELIRRMAFREGWLGNLLANGTKRAAREVGGDSWKWAIQARGLEMTMCDTRVMKGYALAFAVNPRGVDHLTSQVMAELGFTEEGRQLIRKITGDEKYAKPGLTEKRAEIVRWHEDSYAVVDCLGFCSFTNTSGYTVDPEKMAQFLTYALGKEFSEDEVMLTGRRILTMERAFNVREGLRRRDDVLPWRMMNEPIADGPMKAHVTDKAELDRMSDEYYALVGWDLETGVPKRETLERLDLLELCGNCIKEAAG